MPSPLVPNPLPLPLFNQIGAGIASELAFAFRRHLGTMPNQEQPEPQIRTISKAFAWDYTDTLSRALKLSVLSSVRVEQVDLHVFWSSASSQNGCYEARTIGMQDLVQCEVIGSGTAIDLSHNTWIFNSRIFSMQKCGHAEYKASTQVLNMTQARMSFGNDLKNHTPIQTDSVHMLIQAMKAHAESNKDVTGCRHVKSTVARDVPCEYYPIPLKPIPVDPSKRPCPRFPSHRLRFQMRKKRQVSDAAMLPFAFQCPGIDAIPILKSYVMLNTITASVDGVPIDILNFSLKTDVNGFCWQGSISVYPDAFAQINIDGRTTGNEAQIRLTVNGEAWIFLAEDYSDSREFGKKTYTITGRSLTAKLTADYAQSKNGSIASDLYARQIADSQLEFLPYTIAHWDIADWFVPGNSYNITDKTPMDNLMDIAKAAGGFVYSHPSLPELSFKPRWKVPAWNVQAASVDVVVPDSVIVSISGQKRVTKRCNSVFAWADHENGKGGDVFREGSDRSVRASAQVHALYTDAPVLQACGIAALSDTGIHKTETVKLPISLEYSIPRANLGELWQFNEQSSMWKGRIDAVEISGSNDNGAIAVWQTLSVDRYMDV